jgi:anti-sigma B factor antagonist
VDLILSTERQDDVAVVAVSGEIDLGTAGQLRDYLAECLSTEGLRDIVLDLSGVTFMDSTGLQVLISTQRRLEAQGGRLRLVGLRSGVAKILRVTGLDQKFPTYETVADAVGDAPGL